ncbi:F-box/LRR-repeat/kelch-repeat protein [Cardamine amara subsp. amara]|uniref:F-box/LRR-repeat/kelch-repeat protein n=1 Tax=Cardamine amara subsp. amara TaxID=228776 RepID=A0ABD0ZP63_CARAN
MSTMQSQACLKKQGSLKMESLHHYVVERIMERLPAKSLARFKVVAKAWKSTIESRYFQEKQLRNRQLSGDPDVLMVSIKPHDDDDDSNLESLRTLVLGSSSSVKIPTLWEGISYSVCHSTCDGIVCLYHHFEPGLVINPTTRWYRPLPLCHLQQLIHDLGESYDPADHSCFNLGFGKDKFTGTYKPVWLYNTGMIGFNQNTTCEVFDLSTDTWRYVTPAPYRIVAITDPVFVDGSLHWFTQCEETKVLSFDLHTEVFQVVAKAPFAANPEHLNIVMCNLDNRLCVSEMKWPCQKIWSFHSSNKTWDTIYTLDLDFAYFWHNIPTGGTRRRAILPLALLDGETKKKKKKKLLFFDRLVSRGLFTHELGTLSYEAAFSATSIGYPVCYFPSLFSI